MSLRPHDRRNEPERIIAIDVRPRSFGFVVFEGPNLMLDWGIKSFRPGVNAVKVPAGPKLLALFDEFMPSAIVARKPVARRRTKRAKILAAIERQAHRRGVPIRFVSVREIHRAFVGFEKNKHEVASILAKRFPTLTSRLPPRRKAWQTEDYRMGIFDAAAVAVAYFARRSPRPDVSNGEEHENVIAASGLRERRLSSNGM